MILDSSQFLNSSVATKFAPVYLFLGEEESLMEKCLAAIKAAYLRTHGRENPDFNIEKFYGEKEATTKVIESCQTFPLLSEKKLVILNHLEKLSDSCLEQISAYLTSPSAFTILALLWNVRPDKATLEKELAQIVAKNGVVVKCWKPFEENRIEWIKNRTAEYEKKITAEAVRFLSEEGGESIAELESEIEKIVLLIGDQEIIEIFHVQAAISFSRKETVWQLLDCLEKKDLKNSMETLVTCLQQGEEPLKILNLIARSLRKSALLSDLRKNLPPSEFFNEIKSADAMFKSGHGRESALLEQLVIELCSRGKSQF